ncbi:hypothetical protein TARUN_3652 [Trichoderma arundinaceum]|uniref:Uncharacterized protein n=1 Tax=Trichoderma arundinaceum TaxID=490622 RepID=A0A395NRX8_TRIAR|nr:hypothetical protein TARUN_3652 [Trichoderma arundinaceum]
MPASVGELRSSSIDKELRHQNTMRRRSQSELRRASMEDGKDVATRYTRDNVDSGSALWARHVNLAVVVIVIVKRASNHPSSAEHEHFVACQRGAKGDRAMASSRFKPPLASHVQWRTRCRDPFPFLRLASPRLECKNALREEGVCVGRAPPWSDWLSGALRLKSEARQSAGKTWPDMHTEHAGISRQLLEVEEAVVWELRAGVVVLEQRKSKWWPDHAAGTWLSVPRGLGGSLRGHGWQVPANRAWKSSGRGSDSDSYSDGVLGGGQQRQREDEDQTVWRN